MARIDVKLYTIGVILTLALFFMIFQLNNYMSSMREDKVNAKMNEIVDEFEEIETMYYMHEYIKRQNGSCDALVKDLVDMEEKIWKLDDRIKSYGDAVKLTASDEFYRQEKKKLNRRQLLYLKLLDDVKELCGYDQTEILYFYGDCYGNKRCDEQGFVLTYINQKIDDEIIILNFDADYSNASVNTLIRYYGIDQYPALVVEGVTYPGLHNRQEVEEILCRHSPQLSLCTGA